MTRARHRPIALVMILLILVPFGGATAKPKDAGPSLTLPLAGTSLSGATFTGTLTVNRFVAQGSAVFAEGVVTGTVRNSSGIPLGTALQVPVVLPVSGNWGPVARLAPGRIVPASTPSEFHGRIILAQTCGVLHLEVGAVDLNLLGVIIVTSPITLDISGDSAGALGALACSILGLVGTVANLVNLLNQLLGALGGAVGGVLPQGA